MNSILSILVQIALLALPLLKPLAKRAPESALKIIHAVRPIIDDAQRLVEEELNAREEARRAAEDVANDSK